MSDFCTYPVCVDEPDMWCERPMRYVLWMVLQTQRGLERTCPEDLCEKCLPLRLRDLAQDMTEKLHALIVQRCDNMTFCSLVSDCDCCDTPARATSAPEEASPE